MSRRHSMRLDWRRGNVLDLRRAYERACRVTPAGASWRMIEAEGRPIRVLVHESPQPTERVILYFHGGGWMFGSPATHADISRELARTTGSTVVSVDYRLAPEHKAPAAIADGLAVLNDCCNAGFASVILAGDSAGGALALAVEREAAKRGDRIAGVCSFYGAFGHVTAPCGKTHDGLDALSIRRYWRAANGSAGKSPYSISALADGPGCPVHLVIAGRDPLRDDSIALARAFKDRSVSIDMHPFEGHSFLQHPLAHRAKQTAYRNIARWIGGLE
jgi:acetyl esterase/lipase